MSSSSSPIELMILTVELQDSIAQDQVRHCIRPSEGLSACLYVHHAASRGIRKKTILSHFPLSFNLVKVQD